MPDRKERRDRPLGLSPRKVARLAVGTSFPVPAYHGQKPRDTLRQDRVEIVEAEHSHGPAGISHAITIYSELREGHLCAKNHAPGSGAP